jgi:hypothetical protein
VIDLSEAAYLTRKKPAAPLNVSIGLGETLCAVLPREFFLCSQLAPKCSSAETGLPQVTD